jgi:anti-sigma factor RsiW
MSRCEPILTMLTAHAAGELSEIEDHRVRRHLATCPACRGELARERKLRELAAETPPVRCPDQVVDSILAAVDADERLQRRAARRAIATWPRTMAAASMLAAAVLLALVLPRNPTAPTATVAETSGEAAWTQAELDEAREDVAWALAFTADIIDRTEKRSLVDALRLLQPAVRSADGPQPGAPTAPGGQG